MSMMEWAEREVELACARERAASENECEWDYGCACYESALKAYKSLCEDGHSGCSFGLTKQILIRLMDSLPLTPIEDTDDIWSDGRYDKESGVTTYQCKRMSSLFKDVGPDGKVEYHDINRFYCVDINHPDSSYHSGFISGILNRMFPITMPYIPERPSRVVCGDFLLDPKNGDYDHQAIYYLVKPDGHKHNINLFFKEVNGKFVEITQDEYMNDLSKSKEKENVNIG